MTHHRSTAALVVALACVLGATACASSGDPAAAPRPTASTTTTAAYDHQPGHTTWTETFVDTSRPTAPKTGTSLPSRTLETTIYRPNGKGPFPLILFAHGSVGHPEKFTKLLSVWADAGFAVAAPAFPLTNSHVANASANNSDVTNQPGDMSFVLDRVLALDQKPGNRLSGALDEHHIGAGGLSLGGVTTYSLVYSACCRDPRITAAEVLDGLRPDVVVDDHVPLLIAHSDADPVIPYSSAQDAFTAAPSPVWFVTLHGASHATQWENDVTPYDHTAEQLTTDFWDATLNGNDAAFARLQQDATVPGVSSIQVKQ